MRRLYLFIKFCFYLFLVCAIAGTGVGYYYYKQFSKDLPQLDSLKDYAPPVVSEVYSDNGTKVGEFWIERRFVLSPQEIPKLMEQAIIASEDSSFFEHSGIDYMGIVRAMIENLRAGHIVQGGSTITQQVVKSFLLSKERKYSRKIKEAILAHRLEETFSKQEILYLYLNQIYFGNRAYGIEAAARNYFNKSAKELTIAEAAMVVGLAKAPTKFNPIRNYSRAKKRQEYVITRMFEEGFISEEQMEAAKAQKLKIFHSLTDKEFNLQHAPWFTEEIRRYLSEKYGDRAVYTHGLQVYTTLDLKAQDAAKKAVLRGLTELHKRHGYNGPVKKLTTGEYDEFNYQNQRQLYFENLEPGLFTEGLTRDIVNATKVSLDPNKIYQGLVTSVSPKEIEVQVGSLKGVITERDFGWARSRSNASHGYDGVLYLRNATQKFSVGDVVEVKQLDLGSLNEKTRKTYSSSQLYLTLEETPAIEGALFSYDPHSGYVKAVIGGKDYAKSEFNRATQATRQTGSVFKPFLYAAALDKGYRPDTIIADEPLRIPDGPGRFWSPKNYGGGYKGPMTFRSALIASRNVVSVRIILDIGVEYVTALVRKLGVTTKIDKVYSMSLGANDMKLQEVARAFGVFPTGGILPDLIYIKKLTNRFGAVLEQNQPPKLVNFLDQIKQGNHAAAPLSNTEGNSNLDNLRKDLWSGAQPWYKKDRLFLTPFEEIILYGRYIPEGYTMNPQTAYTMVSIMQDIVRVGTGYKVHELGRPAAGKTGTTNDQTDCWFVGYTPNLVAGVWVGYDEARFKVGGGETGGKAAAPIFLYYMQEYLKGTPVANFEIPSNLHYAELEPPVDVSPGNVSDLFVDTGATGGADFFADDI